MKRILALVLFVISASLAVAACSQTNNAQEKTKEEVAEDFLQECFTADKDNRYQIFLSNEVATVEEQQETMAEYYSGFSDLASSQCIESMMSTRFLSRYDSLYEGIEVSVNNISLGEPNEEDVYNFTVQVVAGNDEEEYQGQITVAEFSGKFFVNSFWCEM